jgi:hypothetical protein
MADGLLLRFDTDDPEFIRGVEVGMVWAHLESLPVEATTYERTVHTANLEMLLRVADSLGWALRPEASTDEDGVSYDEWTVVSMTRLSAEATDD